MIAALQPLAEMLALEANLQAALDAAMRKLEATRKAKAAAGEKGSGKKPPGGGEAGDANVPWDWTLFGLQNGPETELGGSTSTPNFTPQGKG